MADRWADWQTSLSATGLAGGAAEVVGQAFSFHQAAQAAWEVTWPTGITKGDVVIETSSDASYTGTWREIFRFTWSAPDNRKDGQEMEGRFAFMRARLLAGTTGAQTSPVVAKCQAEESFSTTAG